MNYPTIDPATAPSTVPSTLGLPSRGSILRRLSLGALSCSCILALAPALMTSQALAEDEGDSIWTEFIPSTDTRLIFVSSTEGKDTNTGYTADSPVKSLAKGYALLRDGSPDWLLLKRGDTWNERFPNWNKSGRSESEIMIVGAYGDLTVRPEIRPQGEAAIQMYGSTPVEHIAFVGLHLEPKNRQENQNFAGVVLLKDADNLLFEDLYVSNFSVNFNLQAFGGAIGKNIRLNGCVVVDAWSQDSHAQGIYSQSLEGLTIENCVFDHNGYMVEHGSMPTIFSHNMYINNGSLDVVIRNNIIANASSHGIQLRPGGIIEDNLFLSNPIGILLGSGMHPEADGVTGSVQRNLIMYGRSIGDELPRSGGIDVNNVREATIASNIFYKSEIGYNGSPINLEDTHNYGITNTTISHNSIIDWHGGISITAPGQNQRFENIRLENNGIYRNLAIDTISHPLVSVFDSSDGSVTISGNTYNYIGMHFRPFMDHSRNETIDYWKANVDPSGVYSSIDSLPAGFGIDKYLEDAGETGDLQDFLAMARKMSRAHVDPLLRPQAVYTWHQSRLPD